MKLANHTIDRGRHLPAQLRRERQLRLHLL